jgi:anti-sigma regulatory factor (Ser/Thr protein kinase)
VDDTEYVNELAQVADLRGRFVAALERSGVGGDELQGWALIFTELVNNALEHGCRRPGDLVRVNWGGDDGSVWVTVADPRPDGVTQRDFDDADCEGFAETGRGAGLFLVRSWVDDVCVRRDDHGGTEVRVVRRRETAAGGTER